MDLHEKEEINYKRSLEALQFLNSEGIIDNDTLRFYEIRVKSKYNIYEELESHENEPKPRPNADIIYRTDRPGSYIRYSCPVCGKTINEGEPCCNCEKFFDWSKKATINKYKDIIEWE